MARDCIFYSEDNDMGATIPFCDFEDSSDWNCCEYYEPRVSTQERCPHYISRKDGLETLRRQTESRTTRREKWTALVYEEHIIDNTIEEFICRKFIAPTKGKACPDCPLGSLCRSYINGEITFEQYMAKVTDWLNQEVDDD